MSVCVSGHSLKRRGKGDEMNKLGTLLLCVLLFLPSVSFAGWLQHDTCYSTQQEAVDAHFASWGPVMWPRNQFTSVYQDVSNVAGVWRLNEYEILDGAAAMRLIHSVPLPVPTFATCVVNSVTAAGIQSSFEWGFGVVSALASIGLVIGFAILAIKKL